MIKKGRQQLYGSDPDAMNMFMDFSRSISSDGGCFSLAFDELMRLNEIFLQTSTMAGYAKRFKDFTIVDATFSVSAYDLLLIVLTNVDCFGKSTMTGFVFAEAETSAITVRALELFGLRQQHATLMSDGASAYALAARVCDMDHVLCVQHYRTGVVAARAGMPCDVGQSYMRECNTLLFECFPTLGEFESKIEELHVKIPFVSQRFQIFQKKFKLIQIEYAQQKLHICLPLDMSPLSERNPTMHALRKIIYGN